MEPDNPKETSPKRTCPGKATPCPHAKATKGGKTLVSLGCIATGTLSLELATQQPQ